MMIGKTLCHPRTERIGQHVEPLDAERREEVADRVGEILAAGRLREQVVAQHVSRRVPRNYAEATGEAGELETPAHRIGADAVQQHQWRSIRRPCLHVAEPVAGIALA
jgi:hypothetical protein